MAKDFDHKAIEKKWQEEWAKQRLYETPDSASGKDNFYTLVEFPYPSGDLHIGHWYAYAVPDAYARMKRMQGKNVLYPMGFDEFGLPAENAAIKRNINPREWIDESVEKMRTQLKTIGASFDWSREVRTSSPEYMKWTQWLFLKLYEKGLAYRAKSPVNWCPVDQTVLANEQVIDGKCERCGSEVVLKELEQWFFKITEYAPRLVKDLDQLDWPEPIKESQKNWIGKSEGAEIVFPLAGYEPRHFIILHGFSGHPDGTFHPWLKGELEKLGHTVEMPQLPDTEDPTPMKQVEYVLKHCTINDKTVLVGHSLGSVIALKVAEQRKVERIVTVGGFSEPKFKDHNRPFEKKFDWNFDWEKIRANIRSAIIVSDRNDHAVPIEAGRMLKIKLGGELMEVDAVSAHFTATREPDVLNACVPSIKVFTTRADTLFGVTFLVLAPEHPWVTLALGDTQDILSNKKEVTAYIDAVKKKSHVARQMEKAKTGIELKGVFAVNPANKEHIPVYVAEYVVAGYGTGALMAVPAHDERDFEFARAMQLPIREVIKGGAPLDAPYAGEGILMKSGPFDGIPSEEAREKICEAVGGRKKVTYKFRDWLVSRQRYWGAPIPIVYDTQGNAHPVPYKHLPWLLPRDADVKPKGTSPLGTSKELVERTEKIFGKGWRPETDTMDGFVDNSWYFLRYLDPKNDAEFSSLAKQKQWMPIARYSGGAEHTTVHVLYSRFLYKALYDMGLATEEEPYRTRINRGIILAEDGRKMSKRWGNAINPDEQVETVGADAVRTYLAFIGPYNEVGSFPWSTNGLIGVRRFLERVADMPARLADSVCDSDFETLLNQSIKKVTDDIESMKFNTSVSQLMILSNEMLKMPAIPRPAFEIFLKLLAPFAPHLTEELWHELGHRTSIHMETWPMFDSRKLHATSVTIAIQIAGKTKGTVTVASGLKEAEVIQAIRNDPKIAAVVPDSPKRVVYVPGRIINFIP